MVLLVPLLLARPAMAQQDTFDVQLWTQAITTLNVSDNGRVHLEFQPRWDDNVSRSFQILTRTAGGRRLTNWITVWGGHAWVAKPPGPGVQHEQRIWEQASITLPTRGRWAPALRIRQEQRWQGEWADNSHRLRMMARVVRPFGGSRWSLATWNETMVTFDRTAGGPVQGFDQNRLFGGVLHRMTPRETLEAGTMWVAVRQAGRGNTHALVPFVWLNLTY